MIPVDPPSEGATIEELTAWLRRFTEEYNMLIDKINAYEQKEVNAHG